MKQETVFKAVASERDYQNAKWGDVDKRPHEVGAWIALIIQHGNDALAAWANSNGDYLAMEEVRKIAAICVACGEQHGMPTRSPYLIKSAKQGDTPCKS